MTDAKPRSAPADRPTHGLVSVAVPMGRVTRPLFGRHGFSGGAMLVDWPAIVGSAVAGQSLPVRVKWPPGERSGGTLVVKVAPGGFALEMQHLEPLILERINGYFGWKAVDRLKLVQGPLPTPRKARVPGGPEKAAIFAPPSLAAVEDPDLRQALERLGRRLTEA